MHRFGVRVDSDGISLRADVVQLRVGETVLELLAKIRDRDKRRKSRGDLVDSLIIRLPVNRSIDPTCFDEHHKESLLAAICGPRPAQDWKTVFDRAKDRSIHFLGSHEGDHFLTPNVNPHWPYDGPAAINLPIMLEAIRHAEFEYILENSRAILVEQENAVYKVPSGKVVRSFIRVGNIQYSRDSIDSIVFWLLPRLRDCAGILTDTWSISSIALAASRTASQYFDVPPCPVEVLRSYLDETKRAQSQTIESVRHLVAECEAGNEDEIAESKKLLCLISASYTGQLAGRLKEILAEDHGNFDVEAFCIFSLSRENELESLHDLSDDPRFALVSDKERRSRRPVTIDPQIYFPLGFNDIVFRIYKNVADKSKEFFDAYKGKRIISVHRDNSDPVPGRHHAIHIDTERMFAEKRFQERLARNLKFCCNPSAIIHPHHKGGIALGLLCSAHFAKKGIAVPTFAHDTLDIDGTAQLPDNERELLVLLQGLGGEAEILIVDDACITGRRISQYQKFLRNRIGYRGKIHYLVGVARPENLEVWDEHQRYLPHRAEGLARNSVECVEFVLLPNWDQADCPWCKESDYITERIADSELPEALRVRYEKLASSRGVGIVDGLFLELDGAPALELGPNSLYVTAPASQADAFASVAAAIQHLREDDSKGPVLGPRRFPIATVLSHQDYLKAKWTDSVLRATFLRAASPEELIYAAPDKERKRTKAMCELMLQPSPSEHNVTLEVLLAAAMGQCSLEIDENFRATVIRYCGEGTAEYLLRDYEKRIEGSGV